MKNHRKGEPIRRQRSIFYHSPQDVQHPLGIYMHMFPQDLSLGIMPIGGRTIRADFKISITPANKLAQSIIAHGLGANTNSGTLSEGVCSIFKTVSASLCFFDYCIYEIGFLEDRESNTIVGFELIPLNHSQIYERDGQMFQCVPSGVAMEKGVPELILLPKEELIVFKPPLEYDKPLQDVRSNLSRLDKLHSPLLSLRAMKEEFHYDLNAHDRSMKLALIEAVRPIGWNARGTFNDCVTSYYLLRLMVTFEKFKIELRRAMLATINNGLSRIGDKLGFEAKIEIKGLPMRVDISDALRKLDFGETAFTEVIKAFKI